MLDSITAKSLIKENMPVVCSENGQFAIVDHMDGLSSIKLAKDAEGQHHYIPLAWVTSVDDKVHVDRTGTQAMKDWSTTPAPAEPAALEAGPQGAENAVERVSETITSPVVVRAND